MTQHNTKDLPLCAVQYIIDHSTAKTGDITAACGISASTVNRLRRELGIIPPATRATKLSVCHIQTIIDNQGKSAKWLARNTGLTEKCIKNLQLELGLTEQSEIDVTPWQLAKRAKYNIQRTAKLLERYGYERWSMRDVAWLCSEEGRLHG